MKMISQSVLLYYIKSGATNRGTQIQVKAKVQEPALPSSNQVL